MGNKELKPCPFCGSMAFSYSVAPSLPGMRDAGYVECAHCTAAISADSKDEAVELWNRRAEND